MTTFAQYIDSDVLPGDVYSAGLSDYRLQPQLTTQYIAKKKFKFQPEARTNDKGESFQKFLALQNNPELLIPKLPNTPFGNLGQYMGV